MKALRWAVTFAWCLVPAVFFAQQPQPTFRAAVTLVSTDVIARDSKGAFVADLTK